MTRGLRMGAGELTERLTIRRPVYTDAGGGARNRSWTTVATNVRAKVAPKRGDERLHADQLESRRDYDVTIRRRTDLSDQDVFVWPAGGLVLSVRFIGDHGPRAPFARIECEAGLISESDAGDGII